MASKITPNIGESRCMKLRADARKVVMRSVRLGEGALE